jgi:hypothetical protein
MNTGINSLIIIFTDLIVFFVMPGDLNRACLPAGRHPFYVKVDSRLRGNDDQNVQTIMGMLIRISVFIWEDPTFRVGDEKKLQGS